LFGAILALKALYPQKGKWAVEVFPALQALVQEYQAYIQLQYIGFPEDWETQLSHSALVPSTQTN
jgi:abortive infection bacteriophage resistance protein